MSADVPRGNTERETADAVSNNALANSAVATSALANTAEFPVPALNVAHLVSSALMAPADEGARITILHWLYQLIDARERWQVAVESPTGETEEEPSDPAARHSAAAAQALLRARASLHGLGATLCEHRRTLDINEGRFARRALEKMTRATGIVRDRSAQREWLEVERERLPEAARVQADAILKRLRAKAVKDQKIIARAFRRFVDPLGKRMAKRVSRYTETHMVGKPTATIPFAWHLADRIEHGAVQLRHDMGTVTDVTSQDALHRVCKRLKRQGVMLSPFAGTHPDIDTWNALATNGQNMLGAMRDAIVLADVARARKYSELATELNAVALTHYLAFAAAWSHNVPSVMANKSAAVAVLRAMSRPHVNTPVATSDSVTTASAAARMHIHTNGVKVPVHHSRNGTHATSDLPREIERKFLLHGLPPEAAIASSIRIEQGWLPGSAIRERLRRITEPNGQERCTRTIKLGRPGNRIEIEEPTDATLFAQLWPMTIAARIRKRRHMVPVGNVTWEIDVFLDRDLVLAEVELQTEDQAVELPNWLAPFVVREVTDDPNYFNSVMAKQRVGRPNDEIR